MNRHLQELVNELKSLAHPDGTPVASPDLISLLESGLHHAYLPNDLQPAAAEAIQMAFEAIGGVPRLAMWADRYPANFYKLYARQTIPTIAPVLPSPPEAAQQEWPAWLTSRRLAYQEAGITLGKGTHTDDDDATDV